MKSRHKNVAKASLYVLLLLTTTFLLISCGSPDKKIIKNLDDLRYVLSKTELEVSENQKNFARNIVENQNSYLLRNQFNLPELLKLYETTQFRNDIYNEYLKPLSFKLYNENVKKNVNWYLDDSYVNLLFANNSPSSVNAFRIKVHFFNAFQENIYSQNLEIEEKVATNDTLEYNFLLNSHGERTKTIMTSPNAKYTIEIETVVFEDTLLKMNDFYLIKYL